MVDVMAFKNRAAALVSDITHQFSKLLEEAYDAGFEEGRTASKQEAKTDIEKHMLAFLATLNTENIPVIESRPSPKDGGDDEGSDRLPPGTVKPTVLKTIQQFPEGISIRDIEQLTGFKHSSVRGTVWLLQKEGEVQKGEGNLWVPSHHEAKEASGFEDLLGPDPN